MSTGPTTTPPTRGPGSRADAPPPRADAPHTPTTWREKFEPLDLPRAELQVYFDDPKYQARLAGNSADVREPGERD